MKRFYIQSAVMGALVLVVAGAAVAQGPPPGGPGGFGGPPSPQMQQWFAAMQKWRASHKNVMAVNATIRGLASIEGSPATALNKKQANRVLEILTEWKNKPVMTDEQAAAVNGKIKSFLTASQKSALQTAATARFGGFGGRPGGPGGRPGGPGRPGGFGGRPGGPGGMAGRPSGPPPAPKDYNPLNPSTLPFQRMQARMQQQLDTLKSQLAAAK